MKSKVRHILITLGIAVGLIAAGAAPAMAGGTNNHSEPITRR